MRRVKAHVVPTLSVSAVWMRSAECGGSHGLIGYMGFSTFLTN